MAVDVGNSQTALGLFDEGSIERVGRIDSGRIRTDEEAVLFLRRSLEAAGAGSCELEGSVIGTVVPRLLPPFVSALKQFHSGEPVVVGPGLDLGITLGVERPEEVGADRIADAVAAFAEEGGPLIVVDLGTATTFDAVRADGLFLGGAIAPGVATSAAALARKAVRLFETDLTFPERAIGTNTDEAIRSGVLWGAIALVDGLVGQIRDELGGGKAIATGGLAERIVPHSRTIDRWDKLLTLKGLRLLYERNCSSPRPGGRQGIA